MTGELTLHGKILRTGGIKEKVLLARREQIWDVIIPSENEPDISMLPENIKEGINFHFVSDFKAVYQLLFTRPSPAFNQSTLSEPKSSSQRVESVV
jgi:ATP-dependent Lon protease